MGNAGLRPLRTFCPGFGGVARLNCSEVGTREGEGKGHSSPSIKKKRATSRGWQRLMTSLYTERVPDSPFGSKIYDMKRCYGGKKVEGGVLTKLRVLSPNLRNGNPRPQTHEL